MSEKSLKPEILKLGEIDTSPWNYFPLSELLLVPLIILYGTEEGRVIPHPSTSLHLSRLRRLSRALALSPRGCCLFPMSHQKNRKEGDEAGREGTKHNQEKTDPNKNPRCAGIELKSAVTRAKGGTVPKTKP